MSNRVTWSRAGLGVLIMAFASPAVGQTRAPAPATFAQRLPATTSALSVGDWLSAEVARRWSVDPSKVELDWGDTPSRLLERSAVEVDLSGGNSDSWMVTLPANEADGSRRLLVRAGVRRPLPVAAREIARGQMLQDDDITWADRVEWGPPGAELDDPVGMQAQRRIPTGETLVEPTVLPGPWVESRDPVEVLFRKGRVTIALRGTALGDGRPGEQVHVRLEDGRRVQGRAIGPGRVALEAGGDR